MLQRGYCLQGPSSKIKLQSCDIKCRRDLRLLDNAESLLQGLRGGGEEESEYLAEKNELKNEAISNELSSPIKFLSVLISGILGVIKSNLSTGSSVVGFASLIAVSASALIPLAIIHQSYSFTVGYGASVAAMSLALLYAFSVPSLLSAIKLKSSPALLANCCLLYGIRLTSFLLLRNWNSPVRREQIKSKDTSSKLKRIPSALSISIFYAFMVSPVYFALFYENKISLSGSVLEKVQWVGVGLAFLGLSLEAISDLHKYIVKRNNNAEYGGSVFVGPTGGAFALCRHPNYLGEVLFWSGVYLGGSVVSIQKSIGGWACGTIGLYGITLIMRMASKRLDEKQNNVYGGQPKYEEWKARVKASLVPFSE